MKVNAKVKTATASLGKSKKAEVLKHLKKDSKEFVEQIKEDKALAKKLKKGKAC